MNELVIKYIAVGALALSLGGSLYRATQGAQETTRIEEERQTALKTVEVLSQEVNRLTVQLEQSSSKQQDVVETITERKDGTKVTKRTIKSKEDTQTKQISTQENSKQESVKTLDQSTTERKVNTVTISKPMDGGARLGLGLGVATRIGLDWSLGVTPYVSYETKYRIAPSVGVEFNSTFSVPRAVYVGLEFRF